MKIPISSVIKRNFISYRMPKGVSKEEKTAHKSLVIHEINVGLRQFNNLSSHHKLNSMCT